MHLSFTKVFNMCSLFFFPLFPSFFQVLLKILPCVSIWTKIFHPPGGRGKWQEYISLKQQLVNLEQSSYNNSKNGNNTIGSDTSSFSSRQPNDTASFSQMTGRGRRRSGRRDSNRGVTNRHTSLSLSLSLLREWLQCNVCAQVSCEMPQPRRFPSLALGKI